MVPDDKIIKSLSAELRLADSGEEDLMIRLARAINHLIQNDFTGLVQILYRRDVSESKLKEMLAKYPDDDPGWIIGQLLIDRERRRQETLQQFRKNDNIPEDEKW
jgi:hypothetical protein